MLWSTDANIRPVIHDNSRLPRNPNVYYLVLKKLQLISVRSQLNIVLRQIPYLFKANFNIVLKSVSF
jgi:hypothetical protein